MQQYIILFQLDILHVESVERYLLLEYIHCNALLRYSDNYDVILGINRNYFDNWNIAKYFLLKSVLNEFEITFCFNLFVFCLPDAAVSPGNVNRYIFSEGYQDDAPTESSKSSQSSGPEAGILIPCASTPDTTVVFTYQSAPGFI